MSATNSTGADISRHIFTPGGTTVAHSWTHPLQSNQDGDPIIGVCSSDSDIPVPRVELELLREWWLNKTKIEDPDRDPYKLTHGGYNLKDPSWWDGYEPGDIDRLALPRVEELFDFLRQQLKDSGDARAGETLAPPSAPTSEGPTRRRGRPPLNSTHRKPRYAPTGRPRGRPPLDPAHYKPEYLPTGRPRGRPPLDPANRKPKYAPTGRPRGRPPLTRRK
ncbi:hypothetical protein V8F06_014167 [Rhypophila decipiens]